MRITFVFDNNHFGIGVLHHACMSTTTTVSVNQTKWKTKGYRSSTTLPLAVDRADTALWFCTRKSVAAFGGQDSACTACARRDRLKNLFSRRSQQKQRWTGRAVPFQLKSARLVGGERYTSHDKNKRTSFLGFLSFKEKTPHLAVIIVP